MKLNVNYEDFDKQVKAIPENDPFFSSLLALKAAVAKQDTADKDTEYDETKDKALIKKYADLNELLEQARLASKVPAENANEDEKKQHEEAMTKLHKLGNQFHKTSWGRVIAGIVFALVGIAVLVASGIAVAISFGALTPAAAMLGVLASSMVAKGVGIAAGALGAASIIGSGTLFSQAAKKSPITQAVKDVEHAVHQPRVAKAA